MYCADEYRHALLLPRAFSPPPRDGGAAVRFRGDEATNDDAFARAPADAFQMATLATAPTDSRFCRPGFTRRRRAPPPAKCVIAGCFVACLYYIAAGSLPRVFIISQYSTLR